MMSKPASVTGHPQESLRDEPPEAAKIPLKGKGLDIASQMQSVTQAGPGLTGALGDYAASVAQTLGVIDAIETALQQKRQQIEEIQARQEILAREYRQLGITLDAATKDLAEQFIDIIADLETGQSIAPADSGPIEETRAATAANGTGPASPGPRAPEPRPSGMEAPAEKAPDADHLGAEPTVEEPAETGNDLSAEKAPEADPALDLDLGISDLPPVPEFLGGSQETGDKTDDSATRDPESGSRPWWKHGKKG